MATKRYTTEQIFWLLRQADMELASAAGTRRVPPIRPCRKPFADSSAPIAHSLQMLYPAPA